MHQFDQVCRELFGHGSRSWSFVETRSLYTEGHEIVVMPKERSVVLLKQRLLSRMLSDPSGKYALAEHLHGQIRDAAEVIVDKLDESIGRPKRVPGKVPAGKCHFCGAPYHERP